MLILFLMEIKFDDQIKIKIKKNTIINSSIFSKIENKFKI